MPNVINWFRTKNWYEVTNSIVIWITVGFIGFLIVLTSGPGFSSFGNNQLFMLAFISLLLIFRYIRKIKIGKFLEAEFKDFETHHQNIMKTLQPMVDTLNAGKGVAALLTPEMNLNYIRDELLKAKGNIETIKSKADVVY